MTEGLPEVTGTLSLAVMIGPEWVLTDFAWSEPAPALPKATLVFEANKISGSAGCNRYFADINEDREMPGNLTLGPIGSTRKMCPEEIMTIEDRYLRQLAGVSSYSFLAGQLALSWQADDEGGIMLFARRESTGSDS